MTRARPRLLRFRGRTGIRKFIQEKRLSLIKICVSIIQKIFLFVISWRILLVFARRNTVKWFCRRILFYVNKEISIYFYEYRKRLISSSNYIGRLKYLSYKCSIPLNFLIRLNHWRIWYDYLRLQKYTIYYIHIIYNIQ